MDRAGIRSISVHLFHLEVIMIKNYEKQIREEMKKRETEMKFIEELFILFARRRERGKMNKLKGE